MICESIPDNHFSMKLDQPFEHTVWLGHPPPLLRLAAMDLALPKNLERGFLITLFADPLMLERIFSINDGGVDSIVLHFLPSTNQMRVKDETMRTPSVHPVLSTCQGESVSPSQLLGFVSLADSFGYAWIVGVTISQECFVLEMKSWDLLLPINVEIDNKEIHLEEPKERDMPDIISKELLAGPKTFLVPQISPNLSLTANSIEGRSALHQSFKLFHENCVEYAHKVYFELKHHAPHLKRIIDDLQTHLNQAHQKLLKVEQKQAKSDERTDRASQCHNSLEECLKCLHNLPEVHKKPLSRAEREFKSELDELQPVELGALRSTITALIGRLRRHTQSLKGSASNDRRLISERRTQVQDSKIIQLKSALEKLSLVNSENLKKVELVDSAIKNQEMSR